MAYLTIGSLKCLFKEDHEDYDPSNGKCQGVILPQLSICIMLVQFLIVRLVFLPLTTTKISLWEATSFTNISFKLKLQMVFLGILLFGNTLLFGLMEEWPASPFVMGLFGVNVICVGILMLSEMISIIFLQTSRGRRDSQVDRGDTDSIAEHLQGTAGSMEIVWVAWQETLPKNLKTNSLWKNHQWMEKTKMLWFSVWLWLETYYIRIITSRSSPLRGEPEGSPLGQSGALRLEITRGGALLVIGRGKRPLRRSRYTQSITFFTPLTPTSNGLTSSFGSIMLIII